MTRSPELCRATIDGEHVMDTRCIYCKEPASALALAAGAATPPAWVEVLRRMDNERGDFDEAFPRDTARCSGGVQSVIDALRNIAKEHHAIPAATNAHEYDAAADALAKLWTLAAAPASAGTSPDAPSDTEADAMLDDTRVRRAFDAYGRNGSHINARRLVQAVRTCSGRADSSEAK